MKYFQTIAVFLISSLCATFAPTYAAPHISEDELAIRVTSRILEAAEVEGLFYEQQLTRTDEKTFITVKSKEITKSVLSDLILKVAPHDVSDETVVEIVKRIPTEVVAEFVRNSLKPIVTYTRLKGVAVGLSLVVSLAVEISVPVLLAHMHHPELIPLSAVFPYHLIALSSGLSIQKKLIHERLVQLHGGRKNYEAYLETINIARSNLIETSPNSLSLFVAGESGSALFKYENPTWFKTLLRKLGWRDDKLSYTSLDKFCEKRGLFDYFRKNLKASSKTDLEKTWTLLQAIYKTQDRNVLLELQLRYKKSLSPVAEIANINEILPDVLEWTRKVLESKDIATLFQNAKNIPDKATPYLISLIWENEIMPELAQRNEIPFGQMRRLSKSLLEIQAVFKPLESFHNQKLKTAWVKYLTLGSEATVCDDLFLKRQVEP